jgi:hypothetical protein
MRFGQVRGSGWERVGAGARVRGVCVWVGGGVYSTTAILGPSCGPRVRRGGAHRSATAKKSSRAMNLGARHRSACIMRGLSKPLPPPHAPCPTPLLHYAEFPGVDIGHLLRAVFSMDK